MGPYNPPKNKESASPERLALEASCRAIRRRLNELDGELEGFQELLARRQLVLDALESFKRLQDSTRPIDEVSTAIQVLENEAQQLEERFRLYNAAMFNRNIMKGALDHNESLLAPIPEAAHVGNRPVWEGAKELLAQKGGAPMSATEIAETLMALGWKIDSKTPAESVRTTLLRKPDVFLRVAGGQFRLVGKALRFETKHRDSGPKNKEE